MTRSRLLGSSLVLLVVSSFMDAPVLSAQGVTTATVTGIVSDSASATPIGGATIVERRQPA